MVAKKKAKPKKKKPEVVEEKLDNLMLDLDEIKSKKVRITLMLSETTAEDLESFMKEIPPPTRFDGKPKKNFRSVVAEAILRRFFSKRNV